MKLASDTRTHTSPLSKAELNYFKNLLLRKREEAEEEMEFHKMSLGNMIDTEDDDNSSLSHHMADAATGTEGIDMYYRLIDRNRKYINQLNRALERIENGVYGICQTTGKPIPKGRLEAVPHTRHGIEAKKRGLDKQLI